MSGISIGGTRGIGRSKEARPASNFKKSIRVKTFCLIGGCYVSETSEYEFQWDNSIAGKK